LGARKSNFPATTVKVLSVEPFGDAKVRITLEMIADTNRLAEVGSQLLRTSVGQMKAQAPKKK
jgi:hypothetical protein